MLVFLFCLFSTISAQDTQYGGDPLLLGAGARALGLGGAFVAISDDATAFYWNPAGLTQQTNRELHAQHTEQFGGSVNHDVIAFRLPLRNGGLGFGLIRLGVDNISLTSLEDPTRPIGPDNRPILSQTIGTTDNTLYVAYGHPINSSLTLGMTLKLIHRDLNLGTGTGFGVDTGLLYQSKYPLKFAFVIRNLTKTRVHFDAGNTDTISPSLLMGTSYIYTFSDSHRLLGGISGHFGEDTSGIEGNQMIHLGIEYQFKQRLMLRLGRRGSHLTAGSGIKLNRATIDLAFLQNTQLNNTYRISTSIFF
jgi:hypothetical protein